MTVNAKDPVVAELELALTQARKGVELLSDRPLPDTPEGRVRAAELVKLAYSVGCAREQLEGYVVGRLRTPEQRVRLIDNALGMVRALALQFVAELTAATQGVALAEQLDFRERVKQAVHWMEKALTSLQLAQRIGRKVNS